MQLYDHAGHLVEKAALTPGHAVGEHRVRPAYTVGR